MIDHKLNSTIKSSIKDGNSAGESKTLPYLWLAFIVWPLLGFILAWRYIRFKSARNIIVSFYALYGLLYVINPAMDGARRANQLEIAHLRPFWDISYQIENLYESTVDFLDPMIIFIVSRFTDFHGILFAVYGIIFGVLSLRYFHVLLSNYSGRTLNYNALAFFFLLVCANFVFNIGGFRMWSAAWIFSLGTLLYIKDKSLKYIVFAGFSIFMHFSFIPLMILLIGYYFLGNRPVLYALIAFGTFFINDINIEMVQSYASNLGTALEGKIDAYTHERYIRGRENAKQNYAWFLSIGPNLMFYFTIISVLFVFISTKAKTKDCFFGGLFSMTLLLLAFSNISNLLPSGGRFIVVFYIFAFSTLFIYYLKRDSNKTLNITNFLGLPIIALYISIIFRIGTETVSLYLVGPSFLLPLGFLDSVPLKEFLF